MLEDYAATKQHCKAVEIMIHIKGGPRALDRHDFLTKLVKWYSADPRPCRPQSVIWRNLDALVEELDKESCHSKEGLLHETIA